MDTKNQNNICPCCGYEKLKAPAYKEISTPPFAPDLTPPYEQYYGKASFLYCACCGYEFGADDAEPHKISFRTYLANWIGNGCHWYEPLKTPKDWVLEKQLEKAGINDPRKLMRDEYDSPWKDIIEEYFEDFMAYYFPEVYNDIDWSKKYDFLDKELQQVVRDAEIGKRLADKLVRVRQKSGEETWVLIHIEIQSTRESNFPERMYIYNNRIYDWRRRKVASFAILADDDKNWRPDEFSYKIWGSKIKMKYNVVKLLDKARPIDKLKKETNPFAFVTLAHLKTKETKTDSHKRFEWKWNLFQLMYKHGYSKKQIMDLQNFLDWMMVLPSELYEKFKLKTQKL